MPAGHPDPAPLLPHWRPLPHAPHLRPPHSPDLALLLPRPNTPAQQLPLYAAREAYNFPFTPRLYKYTICHNEQTGSQLTFDLQLLLEFVPQRLTPAPLPPSLRRLLAPKLPDLLQGFHYLMKCMGPFLPTPNMVGWTELGVVKVWCHEDFSSNTPAFPADSEHQMVAELLKILKNAGLTPPQGNTFEQLLHGGCRQSETPPKEAKKSQEGYILRGIENKDASSKKNITFSYSNKDILENSSSQCKSHHKRTSMRVDQNIKPLSSFQLLPPRPPTTHHHISPFRPNPPHQPYQFKPKTLSHHFSKTTMGSLAQSAGSRAQLHYSTSSNPFAKLHHRPSNRAYSTFGLQEAEDYSRKSDDLDVEAVTNRQSVGQSREWMDSELTEGRFEEREVTMERDEVIDEGKQVMRGSQEVRQDLQALFTSEQETVDYSQLANELDCVLFS